jgi:hypothetical protein
MPTIMSYTMFKWQMPLLLYPRPDAWLYITAAHPNVANSSNTPYKDGKIPKRLFMVMLVAAVVCSAGCW